MYKYVNVLISEYKQDNRLFTYKYDVEKLDMTSLNPGMRVKVPFGKGNKEREGVVISEVSNTNIDEEIIKEIISVPDGFSLFNDEMLLVAQFMAEKYCCSLSECINAVMPSDARRNDHKIKQEDYIKLSDELVNDEECYNSAIEKLKKSKGKFTQAKVELVNYLKSLKNISSYQVTNQDIAFQEITLNDACTKFNLTRVLIKSLEKAEIITIYQKDILNIKNEVVFKGEEVKLNEEQNEVYNKISNSSSTEFLIKGVTGSGKTEVYIKLVEDAVRQGKTGIILVPEIGLTGQMVERFKKHFNNVSIIHSKLSAGEKLEEWKKAKDGTVDVVVGPRSAIFMPLTNIGVIVIDEEHEMTYKSDHTPKYDTCEVAKFRATYNNAKLIYSSATPNIETYLKAKDKKIEMYELNKRFNGKPLPTIKVVDMKEELERGNKSIFSIELAQKIKEKLDKKEQVMIFLNRRGFSTFVSCRKCGHVMKCPDCDIPYVYHKSNDTLKCHYCFKSERNVSVCPKCGSKYIKYFGTGTEKVEQEIKNIFKDARVLRMDADTTSRKGTQDELIKQFKNNEADILIGTQMIAKGYNFPNVTLVCILAADMMLNYQDFRAAERTFQLITQVSGRAGRGEKEGEVILQTYTPEHYAINLAVNYNYDKFATSELMLRKQLNYPPYSSLFYVVFTSENLNDVKVEINKLKDIMKFELNNLNLNDSIRILGPGEALMGKLKNMYRWQLTLKCIDETTLKKFVVRTISKYKELNKSSEKVLIQIDFD